MDQEKLQKLLTTKVHKGKEKGRAGARPFLWEQEFLDLNIFSLEKSKNKCADTNEAEVWE